MPLLPDAASFRRLVDGSRRDVTSVVVRGVLSAMAMPYGLAVRLRNTLYDRGWLPKREPSIPVISVGNLTLGGTGKTPLVAWVTRHLLAMGERPVIVSRGYAADDGPSDEAAELAVLLPNVPHVADRDRVSGVATAVARYSATVAVLDDGFQHRRLARTIDIVAIDASDPFGCGHLFPRGMLRETADGLQRADAVVLTRATSIDDRRRDEVRAEVRRFASADIAWVVATHAPQRLRTSTADVLPLDAIVGARLAIVSGIGNPSAFRRTVESLTSVIVLERCFPDHHPYNADDLIAIGRSAAENSADFIVTTLKDLVKIRRESLGGIPVVAIEIAIEILEGEPLLHGLIEQAVARASSAHTPG